MTRTKTLLLAGAAIALGAMPAVADGWKAEPFTQSMDQRGGNVGDFTYDGVRVWTTNDDAPQIRFGCSERFGLTASVTFLPISQTDPDKNQRIKLRQMTTTMKIEGRKPESVPWTFVRETRTVQTRSRKHAAMIYNAVVQGQPITIKEPRKKNVTIVPAPSDSSFAWFTKNCPITSG